MYQSVFLITKSISIEKEKTMSNKKQTIDEKKIYDLIFINDEVTDNQFVVNILKSIFKNQVNK